MQAALLTPPSAAPYQATRLQTGAQAPCLAVGPPGTATGIYRTLLGTTSVGNPAPSGAPHPWDREAPTDPTGTDCTNYNALPRINFPSDNDLKEGLYPFRLTGITQHIGRERLSHCEIAWALQPKLRDAFWAPGQGIAAQLLLVAAKFARDLL